MEYTSFLTTVIDVVKEIRAALPEVQDKSTCDKPDIMPSSLEVTYPDQTTLRQDLDKRNVTSDCQQALLEVYYERMYRLNEEYQRVYSSAFISLQRYGKANERFHQMFRQTLLSRFSSQARQAWDGLLQKADFHPPCEKSKSFPERYHHSNAPRRASSDDTAAKKTRGHGPEATAILEQTFSFTDSIGRAEKLRLSELTGLTPHQVVIWFQNRRNRNNDRKGKKGKASQPIINSPSEFSPSKQSTPPPSSPTRDFTLSEKKRKSYGALGRASSDGTDSDSATPSSLIKRPRLPSSESYVSDGSCSSDDAASSVDHMLHFSPWSTPSSRSTSSSSTSSSQGSFWESPPRPHGVFEHMNRRHADRANASMPNLTLGTPQHNNNHGLVLQQRSPFTCDSQGGSPFNVGGLDLGSLQLATQFYGTFRENIQRALSMPLTDPDTSRNVSSSSWGSQQRTTDDDEWSDVDESDAADAAAAGQQGQMPTAFQSYNMAALGQPHPAPNVQAAPGVSNTADNNVTDMFDADSFDLSQLFATPANPLHMPTSSPFTMQHQQHQPSPAADANVGGNVTLQMADLEQLLDTNILGSSLPGTQLATGGDVEMQGGNELCMNFDMSSEAFCVV